jgi:hypothetical protein
MSDDVERAHRAWRDDKDHSVLISIVDDFAAVAVDGDVRRLPREQALELLATVREAVAEG